MAVFEGLQARYALTLYANDLARVTDNKLTENPPDCERNVLLLAGTQEAREIATHLANMRTAHVTASLAGVTRNPASYPCATRSGGFGGADGLAAYLRAHAIDAIIDATHPFAAQISRNAVTAARAVGCPLLVFQRASWAKPLSELQADVTRVDNFAAAAQALPAEARALLAVGRQSLAAFADRADVTRIARTVEPLPPDLQAAGFVSIVARPPFDAAHERAFFAAHGLTHVVAKDAGGTAGWPKLAVAAELGLPILLVTAPTGSTSAAEHTCPDGHNSPILAFHDAERVPELLTDVWAPKRPTDA